MPIIEAVHSTVASPHVGSWVGVVGVVGKEFDVGARSQLEDEELRTIYEKMEQMGNCSAKQSESNIVHLIHLYFK